MDFELIPFWYWLCVFFALGACVGSFYNVIVYRAPRGISLTTPPSHCPHCKTSIPLYYNLPIIGWIILRGKSACCKKPISIIYPIGEALCGLLGAFALFAANGFSLEFSAPILSPVIWAKSFALFWLLLSIYPISSIDFKYKLIPDFFCYGGIIAGLLIALIFSIAIHDYFPILKSVFSALVAGGGLFLLGFCASKILKKEAMGSGDSYLLAGYGALIGDLSLVFMVLIIASILGLLGLLPYKKIMKDKEEQIPFGPFLAIAAPLVLLWGNSILDFYLSFVMR